MPANRWRFDDPVTAESYTFEMSPNDGGSPDFGKTITQQGTSAPGNGNILFEGQDPPQSIDFSGVVLTESHYDAMVHWFTKRHVIMVTDDLGRQFFIYITGFSPKRKRSATKPWKHEYTVKATVIRP